MCVFHQRFSTNTTPQWRLCHPFRYLAHNGEINTISGNRKWALARAKKFQCEALPDIEEIAPLVNLKGSDSQSLDNMLEVLLAGGMDIFASLRALIRSEEHTSELQSLMRISYAVFCLKKK